MTIEIEALSAAQAMLVEQLRGAHEYGDAQRARADRLQAEIDKKVLEIAGIIRESEGARLERERLAAKVRRGEQTLERLQVELGCKLQKYKARLALVERMVRPFFKPLLDWVQSRVGVPDDTLDALEYDEGFRVGQQVITGGEHSFVPKGKSKAWWQGWYAGVGVGLGGRNAAASGEGGQ